MKKILIANWKMNTSYSEAMNLADFYKAHLKKNKNVFLIVCPPAIWLESLAKKFKNTDIALGIQNIHFEDSGAFTGEISAKMAKKFVKYTIIGHSERRAMFNENNESVNQKVKQAFKNNLIPIICFGERFREEGIDHILAQISSSIDGLVKENVKKILFAYEPVWAIGTGKVATAEHASKMIYSARERIAVRYGREITDKCRFLYGGSVNAKNINSFLAEKTINGFLAGGASLDGREFEKIYKVL